MPPKRDRIPLPTKKVTIGTSLPSITGAIKKEKRSKSISRMTHDELEKNLIRLQKELTKLSAEKNRLQLERDKWNQACHINKKRIEQLTAEKVNKATHAQKLQDELVNQNKMCRTILKEELLIYENRKNELQKYYEKCFAKIQKEALRMDTQPGSSEFIRPIEEREKQFKKRINIRDDLITDELEAAKNSFTDIVQELKEKAENYLPIMTHDHELYIRVQAFNNCEQMKLGLHNLTKMLNKQLENTKELFNEIVKRDILLILLLIDLEKKFGAKTDMKALEDEVQAEKNTENKLFHEIKIMKEEIIRLRRAMRREKRELREMVDIKEKISVGAAKIESTGLDENTLLRNYYKARNDVALLQDQLKRAPKIFQELLRKTSTNRQQEVKSLTQQAEEVKKHFFQLETFTSSQSFGEVVALQTTLKTNEVEIDKMTEEINNLKEEKSKILNSYTILFENVKKKLQKICQTEKSKNKLEFLLRKFDPVNVIGSQNPENRRQNDPELQMSNEGDERPEVLGVAQISLNEPCCSKEN